ncbi:PKD-like family lipoprotein [Prevotella sp. KH2C16]|uniref:PKD-like family lipoprotein n=1 Tax=Prevotella sp. KH2C16 TaxID=1855325 RepID=UPI0008EABE19|nr:PKD-like family lipoprotein [Prevotella sp. KH2C16]SFG60866.1 PKD-like family protein [Prevotella sp. KH2C16]
MKKILFPLGLVLLLASCYEDKGNYDYTFDKVNAIDSVKFTPEAEQQLNGLTIEFTQPLTAADTLQRVFVNCKQSLVSSLENLDFTWIRSYTKNGVKVKDTLTTKGYMDVVLPVGKATAYNVMLEIHDQITGLSNYTQFNVATRPIFKNSIFVLHGMSGNMHLGNIEKVGTNVNVHTDAYALVHPNGGNPFANTSKLMYQATMTFVNYTQLVESDNLIAFQNGAEAKVFKPFGLDQKLDNYRNYVLPYSSQGVIPVEKIGMVGDPSNQSDYYYIIGKDGRFVTARAMLSFKFPSQEGSENNYRVTAGAITSEEFVFWDGKNNRFLHVNRDDSYGIWGEQEAYYAQLSNPLLDAQVDFSTLPEALSPVGKTGLYGFIQYRENYSNEHPFFIFKDTQNQYYLYELIPTRSGKDDNGGSGDGPNDSDGPAYTVKGQVLEGFSPSDINSICYNTWFPTNYVFYIDGANIIRYNISNGDKVIIYTAPVGYDVACMKFRENNTLLYSADLGRYLTIGLNQGSKGAVTEIKLTTGGDVDESYQMPVYSQDKDGQAFGNIADIQFVHEYSYQVPNL